MNYIVLYLQEHLHFDLVRSTDPEFKKAIIQINIYKQHRQTIQVRAAVGKPVDINCMTCLCISN